MQETNQQITVCSRCSSTVPVGPVCTVCGYPLASARRLSGGNKALIVISAFLILLLCSGFIVLQRVRVQAEEQAALKADADAFWAKSDIYDEGGNHFRNFKEFGYYIGGDYYRDKENSSAYGGFFDPYDYYDYYDYYNDYYGDFYYDEYWDEYGEYDSYDEFYYDWKAYAEEQENTIIVDDVEYSLENFTFMQGSGGEWYAVLKIYVFSWNDDMQSILLSRFFLSTGFDDIQILPTKEMDSELGIDSFSSTVLMKGESERGYLVFPVDIGDGAWTLFVEAGDAYPIMDITTESNTANEPDEPGSAVND